MPSPGSSELRLGPFSGHWYGLLVALGAVVFCVVTALIARRRGAPPYDVFYICVAALPCALIGARLYHLVTGGSGSPGEGRVRDRERGSRHLRRGARRRPRAGRGRAPARSLGAAPARLRDAGARARTGHRPARELVQPGALRRADRSLVGARDRPPAPAREPARPRALPADVRVRGALGPRPRGHPRVVAPARTARTARGRARRVARRVRCGEVLDRGAAHRADAPPRPAAPEPGRRPGDGRRPGSRSSDGLVEREERHDERAVGAGRSLHLASS